jgi:cyclopropane-fatty-acyl-phospholipid synthase
MLQNRIIQSVERALRQKNLPICINFWDAQKVSGTPDPKVTLSLRSPANLALLAKPNLGKLAESYVEEKIDLEGDIHDIVKLFAQFLGPYEDASRPHRLKWEWSRRHTRASDREAVSSHYDLSNDFFALWLDKRRVYSCAYFHTPEDSLDLAQEQKLDHICRKLALQPGERFLDIGCGWGGLIRWAMERYAVHATGITVSRNQYDYVRAWIRDDGLSERCEVRLMDYRDLSESEPFDKIASVGMFEHVGRRNLPVYFGKIFRLLRPGGLVMNHGITAPAFGAEQIGGGAGDFIDRYVFPDGELTHLARVIEVMSCERLEVRDVENLRPHYAKTLRHWVSRLDARRDEARKLVGERKYRVWRAYMAGFAHAFDAGWDSVYQILAARPLADGGLPLPLTRGYIYLK